MHAVVRNYSGHGEKELFKLLEQRNTEVEKVISAVPGFQAYSVIRTNDDGVTITVCKDNAGTDQSVQVARDWIKKYAADLGTAAPSVSEGTVVIHSAKAKEKVAG